MVHKHWETLNNRKAIFSLCEASCEAQSKPDVTSFFVGWCIYENFRSLLPRPWATGHSKKLTPVQSPLWKFTRFSAANFLQTQVLTWKKLVGEKEQKEKPMRKDERRKDLEVICHSELNNVCNMIVPLPKSQTRYSALASEPSVHATRLRLN